MSNSIGYLSTAFNNFAKSFLRQERTRRIRETVYAQNRADRKPESMLLNSQVVEINAKIAERFYLKCKRQGTEIHWLVGRLQVLNPIVLSIEPWTGDSLQSLTGRPIASATRTVKNWFRQCAKTALLESSFERSDRQWQSAVSSYINMVVEFHYFHDAHCAMEKSLLGLPYCFFLNTKSKVDPSQYQLSVRDMINQSSVYSHELEIVKSGLQLLGIDKALSVDSEQLLGPQVSGLRG